MASHLEVFLCFWLFRLVNAQEGSISTSMSCPWRAPHEEMLINHPTISLYDVGGKCPQSDYGGVFKSACGLCNDEADKPKGKFVVCLGCKKSGSLADLVKEEICEFIKNQVVIVTPLNGTIDDKPLDESNSPTYAPPQFKERNATSGVLSAQCKVQVDQAAEIQPKPALRIDFDCGPCRATGVPLLMEKCCDECERFATDATRWRYTFPYVACLGCGEAKLGQDSHGDTYAASHSSQRFKANYSIQAAERRLEHHMCNPVMLALQKMARKARKARNTSDQSPRLLGIATDYDPKDPTACEKLAGMERSDKVGVDLHQSSHATSISSSGFGLLAFLALFQ